MCWQNKKNPCTPFLFYIIPIVVLFVFGTILFDVQISSRTLQVQPIVPTHIQTYEPNTHDNLNQPIFFNESGYNSLIQYHSKTNGEHPTSWIHLSNQLFCPIKYSSSLNPIGSNSNAAERLLKAIYKLQFEYARDCNTKTHQYLILDASIMTSTGLGAITNAFMIKFLFRALMTNRTLLFDGTWQWSHSQSCHAFECYFMPPSHCNVTHIIHSAQHQNEYYNGAIPAPESCNLGEFDNILDDIQYSTHLCSFSVVHITKNTRGMSYRPVMPTMNDKMMEEYACNYQCFRAVAIAFMYRLQPTVIPIVFNKVRLSIHKTFNPMNTVALPIRATDKCRVEGHGGGEMDCWSIDEYIAFLKSVEHLSNGRINTVIITSESMQMIEEMKRKMSANRQWHVILNVNDSMPGSGSAYHVKDVILTNDLEHDVIVGGLSSLLLQMNAKYVAFTRSSNWLDNMWNIAHELNCEQLFWKDRLAFKGYKHEYYFNFNKQCFEMRSFGVLNKKVHEKHILYPVDLWDMMHEKDLTPERFYQRFGVNITDAGWKTYCDRYMEPPFVDALHIS